MGPWGEKPEPWAWGREFSKAGARVPGQTGAGASRSRWQSRRDGGRRAAGRNAEGLPAPMASFSSLPPRRPLAHTAGPRGFPKSKPGGRQSCRESKAFLFCLLPQRAPALSRPRRGRSRAGPTGRDPVGNSLDLSFELGWILAGPGRFARPWTGRRRTGARTLSVLFLGHPAPRGASPLLQVGRKLFEAQIRNWRVTPFSRPAHSSN